MDFFGRYIRFNETDKVAVKLKKMEIFLGLLREQVLNRVMASAAKFGTFYRVIEPFIQQV